VCPLSGSAQKCVKLADDEANCGTCGNACPTGGTCTTGACGCAIGSVTCGRTGGAAGTCCAGNACCGTGCQKPHDNGLGQTYYDCGDVDQWTQAQATLAAGAWSSAPISDSFNCPSCKCVTNGASSAVWCYSGSTSAGFVALSATPTCSAALCPVPNTASTFRWH
jgi:hypothetical protein